MLLIAAAVATATVHAGCSSVYDDLYKPLAGTGGGTGGSMGNAANGGGGEGDGTTGGAGTSSGTGGCAEPVDDGQDCTVDLCENGAATTVPASEGTACDDDGGAVCNATGGCVACNTDADCVAESTPVCDANECVDKACTNGAKDENETDVDCGGACKGCDTDKDCAAAIDCYHGLCSELGRCSPPTCSDGEKNGGGYLANDGETDVDCGGPCGPTCGPLSQCDVNADCTGLSCTGPGGTCAPSCLDMVKNGSETDVDCGGACAAKCVPGEACAGSDLSCVTGAYCAGDVCVAKLSDGAVCAVDNPCLSGICEAADGVCCDAHCDGACRSCKLPGQEGKCLDVPPLGDPEDECAGTEVCDGSGACKSGLGEACLLPQSCASGFCVDGVCCASACSGTCSACAQAKKVSGADGTCGFVPQGDDPDDECSGVDVCDGAGLCKKPNGAACGNNGVCSTGHCEDGVCCNMACSGSCKSCKVPGSVGTCTNHLAGSDPETGCNGGNPNCNGQGSCGLGLQGAPCASAAGCSTGHCVDGFCCNGGCAAACQACAMTLTGQSNGVCSFVSNGTDPDDNCSGITPSCNGAGACGPGPAGVSCTAGSQCQSGSCTGGTCAP